MIQFGIPSYKRCGKVITLDLIESMGVPKSNIHIFTQTKEDYVAYVREYSERANIHYREGSCVADNRNFVFDYFDEGTKVLSLDDDISSFLIKSGNKANPLQGEKAYEFIKDAFDYIEKNNAIIFTVYHVSNGMFMKNTIKKRQFGVGVVFGMIVTHKYRFRREYTVKEDLELCLRTMRDGYNCIRFDFIGAKAKFKAEGGCKEWWDTNADDICTNRLLTEYSDLIKPAGKKNQVKMR